MQGQDKLASLFYRDFDYFAMSHLLLFDAISSATAFLLFRHLYYFDLLYRWIFTRLAVKMISLARTPTPPRTPRTPRAHASTPSDDSAELHSCDFNLLTGLVISFSGTPTAFAAIDFRYFALMPIDRKNDAITPILPDGA
jgi:hypothetical protein